MTHRLAVSDQFDPTSPLTAKSRQSAWYRALKRLDAGKSAAPERDEESGALVYVIGRLRIPPAVITSLARHDMVAAAPQRKAAGKIYVISSPGRAYLRRATAERQEDGAVRGRSRRTVRHRGRDVRAGSAKARSRSDADIYRAQHQIRERGVLPDTPAGSGGRVVVNRAESPLGWLRHRKGRDGRPFLSGTQVEAGETLRKDFEIAGMSPRVTTDLSGRLASDRYGFTRDRLSPTERQLAAKQRVDRAIKAAGPGLDDVLLRVCCFLEGIEVAERALGWPTRSGKLVLGIALERLARHYGLE